MTAEMIEAMERARILRLALLEDYMNLSILQIELRGPKPLRDTMIKRVETNLSRLSETLKQDESIFRKITNKIYEVEALD